MNEIEKYIEELEKALENDEKEKFVQLINNICSSYDSKVLIRYRNLLPMFITGIKNYNIKNPKLFDITYQFLFYDTSGIKYELESIIPENALTARFFLAENYRKQKKYKNAISLLNNNYVKKYFNEYSLNNDLYEFVPYSHALQDLIYPRYISSVMIDNYHSIQHIYFNQIQNIKEIYFLGINGVGKTILLQAIVSELVHFRCSKKTDITVSICSKHYALKKRESPYPNIFAYGVGRLKTHDNEIDETGYGTLFDQQRVNLKHPVRFLEEIERLELKKIGNLKLQKVLKMLTDILNIGDTPNITIEQDGAKFIFKEHGTPVEFKHLADGYRSILLILADLLSRLAENQPHIDKIEDFRGIVLIDEIDMLLHPKWEYVIVKKLREKLPNIQWFFTTHSPMLVLGASKDAIFYRLYKENGETKISEQYKYDDIKNFRSNGIITSPLFGMEYAGMREELDTPSDNVDTSETHLVSRIQQQILERYKTEKAERNTDFIDENEINSWINEALDEN